MFDPGMFTVGHAMQMIDRSPRRRPFSISQIDQRRSIQVQCSPGAKTLAIWSHRKSPDGAVIAATANNDALPIGKTRASSRSARTHPEPRAYLRAQAVYRHAACSSAEMKKPPPGHRGDGFLARAHGVQKVRSNGARKW